MKVMTAIRWKVDFKNDFNLDHVASGRSWNKNDYFEEVTKVESEMKQKKKGNFAM